MKALVVAAGATVVAPTVSPMPRIDERSPLHRLSRTTEDESRSGPGESTPGRSHDARWDEETLEPDERAPGGEAATPAWLSEPCGSVSLWHERLVPERFRGTRWDPGPRGVLIIAVIGILAIVLAGMVALREEPVAQPVPPIAALSDTAPADAEGTPVSAESGEPVGGVAVTSKVAAAPGARNPLSPSSIGAPTPVPTGSSGPAPELVVSVVGLVEHGGLCRFRVGARVADAIRVAGPRPEADLSGLNLAQHLTDGDQIIIGRTATQPTSQRGGSTVVNSTRPAQDSGSPPPGSSRPATPPAKINLNTATEAELDTLPGVGQVTARAILAWRSTHGRFTSIDQLSEIQGIGHSRLERLRARVTI